MKDEKKYKFIKGALGFGKLEDDVAHLSVPVHEPVKIKGGYRVIGKPWIVTSGKQFWPVSPEEQEKRGVYAHSTPSFSPEDSRWDRDRIKTYLAVKEYPLSPLEDVFELIKEVLDKYIDFYQPGYSSVIAVWIIGSYLFPIFASFPYLFVTGPRGSGKTKLLDVIAYLAFNTEKTSNATPSSVFRTVSSNMSTLLIDEAETLRKGGEHYELTLILNAGYKRNGYVTRTNMDSFQVERFDVYSPKIIASINQVDATLRSRGIGVNMIKTNNRNVGNKVVTDSPEYWAYIRDHLYRYALDFWRKVKNLYENEPEVNQLNCRQNELWAPLLAIAYQIDKGVFETVKSIALEDSRDDENVIDDWHASLLKGLGVMATSYTNYKINQIKESMVEFMESDEIERISSRWIGSALKRLGFKRGPRSSSSSTYYIDPVVVKDLMVRYQLVESEGSVHSEHSLEGKDEFVAVATDIFTDIKEGQ